MSTRAPSGSSAIRPERGQIVRLHQAYAEGAACFKCGLPWDKWSADAVCPGNVAGVILRKVSISIDGE